MAEPRHQLNCAREMARHNFIQELCADIAPPADALRQVNEWEGWGDGYGRMCTCSTRAVDTMSVEVISIQHDDGQIERYNLADANDDQGGMTAERARRLAAALIAGADELEVLGL